MTSPVFHRYVALGDSFTEGVGDDEPTRPNGLRGWADRVAEQISTLTPDFGYANLAVRGRLLRPVVSEQVEPAIALDPDLITIYAGANDIMRPKIDIDDIVQRYDVAIGKLTSTRARVVTFTGFDLGWAPVFGKLRGRVAIYNELVREVA
ncbi:MAG: SGNH/GDSL hydrolase family protein, partial [Actinomycetia bacterium]|nr:SGNH/GDSL hydrolase family protein [Actinomycetes bacterium]